ncbi:hypothetical protein EW145_g6656 [Phellinidium pouzarii]|uniref:Uncharacterized protein n=1 Tax=Phellinidium pouzarii TaxID=167371 RepID=A0A4S4KVZ8_9AGAM|nr:hypothetical protein EW145_g6656 [Phellinidium pouzarii]
MTEYATTPSAVEEWNAQRDRTATWVHASLSPELCLPPSRTPSTGSDYARHSLWDGSGWEPPSDCESSVSIPPTMMLQYSDHRKVMISPTQSETSGWKASGRVREGSGTGDGDRTERAQSHRGHIVADSQQQRERRSSVEQIQVAPIVPGAVPSHSSSARLAQAVAAPLPDSHSSSPSSRNLNGSESLDKLRFMARSRSRSPSHTQAALDASTNLSQSYQHAHPASHVSQSHHSSIHSQAQGLSQSNAPSHAAARPSPPPHSNSLSSSHSLSTVPEPIIIHPPAPSASQPSHSTQSGSNSSIYPRSYAPSHYTQQTMQAAAHVPLPPPSTASALLSYYSQSQMRVEPENNSSHHNVSDRPFSQQALMQNNYTPQAPLSGSQRSFSASVQHQTGGSPIYASALLAHSQSHPPTAQVHSHSQSHSQAGRASTVSYGNQAGLGGGYVVVNQANTPEEQAENQGSVGGKSTDSQRHRGSLFNVFGSRGPKSRSLPQVKLEKDAQVLPPPIPDSPESHYSIHSHHSNHSNSYPSPVSPISPPQPIPTSNGNSRRYNPALGPNPPSIVYAPARHGRATRYSPPRIMYMPGTSPAPA